MATKRKTTSSKSGVKKSESVEVTSEVVTKPTPEAVIEVRHSPVPPKPTAKAVTEDDIRTRAYFISISGEAGSEFDNWVRAEAELKNL